MVNGEFWWERAFEYYVEFGWWKYAIVFGVGVMFGQGLK